MGICTACGYITGKDEVHECNEAHVLVGKKARETAQAALVSEGKISVGEAGTISKVAE